MIPRLPSGKKVQISLDGGTREGYDRVLFFKPPFGPYPAELKETFPIGQSELPDWDDEMVRAGCTGIVAYMESNPGTDVSIFCTREWYDLVRQTVPQAEVKCDDI
jgi:7-cyano-7-deazaguanine tRNA-ribosyltransferase